MSIVHKVKLHWNEDNTRCHMTTLYEGRTSLNHCLFKAKWAKEEAYKQTWRYKLKHLYHQFMWKLPCTCPHHGYHDDD